MKKYTYKDSGVNLQNTETLSGLLFSGLQSPNFSNFAGIFEHPVLPEYYFAGTTDGIGTKIIPLLERGLYRTIALDLAAMNLNDLICTGAKPLFFLDYLATNVLNPNEVSNFIKELNSVLRLYNCALIGGETSELGDFIKKGLFDVAGFAVGLVKKANYISKENVHEGDVVIALKSSGMHSNGFSLVRKLFNDGLLSEDEFLKTLEPTVIYVNEILELCDRGLVTGLANITGGGILSNLERTIPDGLCARLNQDVLPEIDVFEALKRNVGADEMLRTFNMGAGFCVITRPENVEKVLEITKRYSPFVFGAVEKSYDGTKAAF